FAGAPRPSECRCTPECSWGLTVGGRSGGQSVHPRQAAVSQLALPYRFATRRRGTAGIGTGYATLQGRAEGDTRTRPPPLLAGRPWSAHCPTPPPTAEGKRASLCSVLRLPPSPAPSAGGAGLPLPGIVMFQRPGSVCRQELVPQAGEIALW